MAKGNLFLGTAHKSVGDVTMYRRNGEQVSRVRVRKIKNPKSRPQMLQRAVMATVMKAYGAGKAIFDHSFEGKTRGEGNMSYFLSVNSRKLRNQFLADEAAGNFDSAESARFVAPKSSALTPFTYQISEGTMPVNPYFVRILGAGANADVHILPVGSFMDGWTETTTLAQVIEFLGGWHHGDIYTIVGMYGNSDALDNPSTVGEFSFVRLTCKQLSAETLAKAFGQLGLNDLFEIEGVGTLLEQATFVAINHFGVNGVALDLVHSDYEPNYVGWIASREDVGIRSTSFLRPLRAIGGISGEYVFDYWNNGSGVADSDLILEGGGF